jgi:hypothetical protein
MKTIRRGFRIGLAALLAAGWSAAGVATATAAGAAIRSVSVVGTEFRVTLADGRLLGQPELVGAVLSIGDGVGGHRAVRIDRVLKDAKDPTGEITLYEVSEQDRTTGAWANLCQPDPDGQRLAFPMAGVWAKDGTHLAAPDGRFSITCTGGAQGKCVRFGYKPWRTLADGQSLAPYYQACVRLVRADYCGNGVGHTRNGTPIDIFDRIGIQADEVAPGMTLEAVWGPEGALCVRHPRLPELGGLDRLAAECPRLTPDRLGAACREDRPGLLFNRSVEPAPATRPEP